MSDEILCQFVPEPPANVNPPPPETPPPEPLSTEQLRAVDAAFAATKEEQLAMGIMAVWAAGPLLVDQAGDHLGKKKREAAE